MQNIGRTVLRRSDFESVAAQVASEVPPEYARNFSNPYFLCVYSTVVNVGLFKARARIADPVEYVLDEHGAIGDIAIST